jgi:K+-transporting ATPase ATPase C chain
MWKQMIPAVRVTLLLTVLTGLIYPGVITALCQGLFAKQAAGSLIYRNGKVIGSSLIGQNFSKPEFFQPRPSAAGKDGYDATSSTGSNLGPTSKQLAERVKASAEKFHKENPEASGLLSADLLTASGSGLDPHLSPASAIVQVSRIAKARGVKAELLQGLIAEKTEGRTLGFVGEPRVNVLDLNLALEERFPLR